MTVRDLHVGTALVALGASVIMASVASAQAATPPPFVGRVIGVYDDRTGRPLDSVEVRDMVSGSVALTTSTGTLSLFFVDTSGSLLRLRKLGYTPVTMFVANSPGDPPMTIMLEPVAHQLPTVVTTDSAPLYRSSLLRGFEDRRKAGQGYFVSEHQLRKEDDRP